MNFKHQLKRIMQHYNIKQKTIQRIHKIHVTHERVRQNN